MNSVPTGGLFWVMGIGDETVELFALPMRPGEERLNHKREWERLGNRFLPVVARGKPYNYFPRGRVELRGAQVVIFLHPDICTDTVITRVKERFGLSDAGLTSIRASADGSWHYRYTSSGQADHSYL